MMKDYNLYAYLYIIYIPKDGGVIHYHYYDIMSIDSVKCKLVS